MRDYVLTAIIFSLVPLCFLRPWIGILVWYWFGLMNPHRLTWSFAYSMPFAMVIGGAVLLGTLVARDRKPIPWNGPLVLVVVLLVYYTFTTFFAWAPAYAWPQWEKVAKIVLTTLVATMFIYGKDRIRALLLVVVFSIGFYGVKGAFFVIRRAGLERVEGPDGSFIAGNTFLGLALSMVIPLLVMLAREEQRPWLKRLLYATAALSFVSTIFTYSRGAFLSLGAITVLLFFHLKHKVLALLILIPAIFLAPGVLPDQIFQRAELITNYEEEGSANERLQSWTVAIGIAKDNPFTGAGFEFEYAPDDTRWLSYGDPKYERFLRHSSAAHSIYFQVLGQHGILAFVLYLALLFGTLISLRRAKAAARSIPGAEWIINYATGVQIALGGYMVAGAFLSSAYFDLAYLFYALSAILNRELRTLELAEKPRSLPGPNDLVPVATGRGT